MAATGQIWVVTSEGGHLTNNRLSKSLREQNRPEYVYRQFVNVREALGKKSGDTVFFDKRLKIDTKGTTLVETNTMPENRWLVVKDSVVVTEVGNAVPYTNKLQVLAEFDPQNISTTALKEDQLEVLDSQVAAQFNLARFVAVCTSTSATTFTSNADAGASALVNMSDKNVRDVVDFLDKKHVPRFNDKNFRAIISVNSRRGVYDYLQAIAQYAEPSYRHNSEVGQYYGTRFAVDNSYLSDAVGSNATYGEAFFFGKESVLEAVALPEEVRMKIPTDYSRSKGVAWYAILGFKKMWALNTDNLHTGDEGKGLERILKVTSD